MRGPEGTIPAEATILVVDDTPSARLTLVELLSDQGYRIVGASSGPEALALAREVLFDLVLLDVMMPGMDGFEVCRTMRADPVLATIPIVLVTALDDRASKLKGLEAGADDFLCKPVDSAELRARVRTIVKLNRFRCQLEERREAAEALARSESRFRALFENAAAAVFVHDLDGRFVEVNRRACEGLGYPRAELLEMGVTEIDGDFDQAAARDLWRRAADESGVVTSGHHRRCDGSTFPVEVHLSQLELGGATHILAVVHDVTQRVAAERELRASEQHFRGLFEESAVGTVMLGPDRRFLRANEAFTRFIGYTDGELRAMTFADVTHPDHAEESAARYGEVVAGARELYRSEKRYVRKDGAVVWGALSLAAVRRADGTLLHTVGVVADIDELKRAQAALNALNAELEQRVRQRTAELEVANRDLESFSFSVSHDLRSPLRAIDGYCQVLAEDHAAALDAEGHRLLGVVRESTARMAHLITDLLSFARVGRTELHGCRVAMGELACSVWEEVAADAPRPDVELVLGDLPELEGDPALLRQVFTNLLGNAVKYSSRAERPRVVVEAVAGEEAVTFSVSDNGVGFDPVDSDRLFQAFQRLHSARDYPGTGIGLALVHRIVERHGGHVAARGEPGKGATFSFTLPVGPARKG